MTDVQIYAGTLTASASERTATGLLVPYGEECSSNLGRFKVDTGVFSIPADLTGAGLTVEHKREQLAGGVTALTETPAGIVATFSFAATPEGESALADARAGRRNRLSAEVADVVLRAGRAVSGRIFGASVVERPAFPSATLLAAAADTEPADSSSHSEDEYTDENGVTWKRVADTETKTETADDGTVKTTSTTTVTEETTPAEEPANPEEDNVGAATVPGTLVAGATATSEETVDKSTFLGMLGRAMVTKDSTLLAALNDVKISGANTIGAAAIVPQYVGELWSGRQFQRKVIPLLGSGDLTSTTIVGWRWNQEPEVDEWDGNKALVPSNTPTATPYNLGFQRFAGGWDIAREYIDFGQTEIVDELLAKAVDSYSKKSDGYVGAQLLAAATSAPVGADPVGSDVIANPGLIKLVRGGLRVIANDALPSFALVAPDVFEQIALVKTNNALEFLSMSLGLEDASLAGFRVVPWTGMAAGTVLVGAREAATVLELPGSPIRVDALDLVKGGVDKAVFGYVTLKVDYPTGLQLVTPNA